jgi:hypothetical protein
MSVMFFNVKTASVSTGGGGVSGSVTNEILNDVSGTSLTVSTVIAGGTYRVYVSYDSGTTYTFYTEGADYSRSGQTLTFTSALTSATVKFEFTYT